MPQGSILGPILFNIYLLDLFFFMLSSDDNSPYSCEINTDAVVLQLENDAKLLLEWFTKNGLKANPDKFHLILNETRNVIFLEIQDFKIYNSNHQKLLGIKIDNGLSFEQHVTDLCGKASQKLHALSRIACYMGPSQRRKIMKAFISSHFGYCLLVWMFHSRKLNNRINRIHKRALGVVYDDNISTVVYDDNISTVDNLLKKDGLVSIHMRNIQAIAIKLYKVVHNFSPKMMNQIFIIKESRYPSKSIFQTNNIRTTKYGLESQIFVPKDLGINS